MLKGAALLVSLVCVVACAGGGGGRGPASGRGASRAIAARCIAVAPFLVSPLLKVESPDELAALFGAYLSEALTDAGHRVIPPHDTTPLLSEAPEAMRPLAQYLAFAGHREFGCNVVALGRVDRFRERSGEALGSHQPASTAFDLYLFGAPGGEALWKNRFDETQKALSENVLRASRYPGGGTRWLRAEELARFGMNELLADAPVAPSTQDLAP